MGRQKAIEYMESTLGFKHEGGRNFNLSFKAEYEFTKSFCAENLINNINTYVKHLNHKNFVQVGIGGSALGATASVKFLGGIYHNYEYEKKYYILDNIDPERLKFIFNYLDPRETLFHIVSKSGTTLETLSQFFVLKKYMSNKLGNDADKHFVFTTDSQTGFLRKLSKNLNIKTFDLAKEAGGRYSVFTPVGLLALAFLGYDIEKFISGAKDTVRAFKSGWSLPNDFVNFAIGEYENGKNMIIMFAYKDRLYSIADWFRQLWAESLGKNLKGQTPIKALGVTDQHSQLQLYQDGQRDKAIVFLDTINKYDIPLEHFKEFEYLKNRTIGELMGIEKISTKRSLKERGVPCADLFVNRVDEYSIGALFASLMIATAKAGDILKINAFDQPGVELGKIYTKEALGVKQ